MTLQRDLTLLAATVGLVSAGLFSFGAISIGPTDICLQATTFYDYSEPLAQGLSAQRAQSIVGAIFLAFSFGLQVAAVVVSPNTESPFPQWLRGWLRLSLATCLTTILLGYVGSRLMGDITIEQVRALTHIPKTEMPQKQNACLP